MNDVYLFGISIVSMLIGVLLTWLVFNAGVRLKTWLDNMEQLSDAAIQIKSTLAALSNTSAINEATMLEVKNSAAIMKDNAEKLQQCVGILQQLVISPSTELEQNQSAMPISINDLTYSFTQIEKELLAQGLDPETAKYKAAEYELDRISGGDISNLSMSL